MTAFRRCFLALAVLVVVLGSIAPASAQVTPFSCTTTAAPPRLRYEGVTELIGDIVVTCSGNFSSLNSGTVNFRVSLPNYPVTSRLLSSSPDDTGGYPADALLLIQGPAGTSYFLQPAGTNPGTCAGTGTNAGTAGCEYGSTWYQSDPDAITFNGVPVLPPGTTGTITYRITDVRIDVTGSPNPGTGSTPVPAYVSVSPSTALPVTTASATVGFISIGMPFQGTSTALNASGIYGPDGLGSVNVQNFLQCGNYTNQALATIRFQEGFSNAFKQYVVNAAAQAQPGASDIFGSESGFLSDGNGTPGTAAPAYGWADTATQLEANITGLPQGVTLVIGAQNVCDSGNSTNCVSGTTNATLTNFVALGCTGPTNISATFNGVTNAAFPVYSCPVSSSGSLDLIWAVQSEVPTLVEDFDFPLFLSFTGSPDQGLPPALPGPATVLLSFNPTVADLGGSATLLSATVGPIPRFVNGQSFGPTGLLQITQCKTYLLYPYVTDVTGFNTGIAISNTSLDPWSTVTPTGVAPSGAGYNAVGAQAGTCAVNFYGGQYSGSTFTLTSTNIGTALSDGTGGQVTSVAAGFPNSGVIAPGETWAFDIATYDSAYAGGGFTGYAIAICNFQYAHGYAFVSDLNIEHFATSYLALIIPGGNTSTEVRTATPFPCAQSSLTCQTSGEQLGY